MKRFLRDFLTALLVLMGLLDLVLLVVFVYRWQWESMGWPLLSLAGVLGLWWAYRPRPARQPADDWDDRDDRRYI